MIGPAQAQVGVLWSENLIILPVVDLIRQEVPYLPHKAKVGQSKPSTFS